MKELWRGVFLLILVSIRYACVINRPVRSHKLANLDTNFELNRIVQANVITRHCECQSPISKLKDLSSSDIDALLGGTLKWPMDNSTTASCCKAADPPGKINGPGDQFEVRQTFLLGV